MKKINPEERRVVNIHENEFRALFREDGSATGEEALQVNAHAKLCVGFHVYRMKPGTSSVPHEHTGDEEFLVLAGELTDNDGYTYKTGDLVWLKQGTQHFSHSEKGALLAVYIHSPEIQIG